jgi:hypothetical protein
MCVNWVSDCRAEEEEGCEGEEGRGNLGKFIWVAELLFCPELWAVGTGLAMGRKFRKVAQNNKNGLLLLIV